jgi:OOP family OmpA-OmpF porin
VKKSILIVSLAAASLAFGANPAFAYEDEPWHLTGQIGGADLSSKRDTRNDDVWLSVGFGRFFGNNISVDLEYDEYEGTFRGYDTVAPGATYDKWKLSNWGVMGRYHFGQRTFRPYIAAGMGRQKHRSVLDEGRATTASLGLGLRAQFARHLAGTAQLMWRKDFDGSSIPDHRNFTDLYYSIGLSFDFGGRPAPPPPPPPPPAPPPAPPPNPDLDGDGVLNQHDKCPNTRPGAVVDLDGCEVEAVIELEGIHFEFDKATLKPEALAILDQAAALLKKHERVVVEVAGHTDSKGSEEYNQGLSERRATAVKDYLNSRGVKASRLTSRGYGESRPVASNDTDEGRAENRRVELIVLDR